MKYSSIEPFLFLYITEKCQLRCKHCYMGDRLDMERHMSLETIEDILSSLKTLYGQYKVYLLGGEPTLHPDFFDILELCKKYDYKVVVTSNGLLPNRFWEKLTENKNYIDSFSFSFDGGNPDSHEFMRGKNTFTPLIKSMKEAVSFGFQSRVIYTVTTKNIQHVPEAIDLAEEIDVEMISFHYFTPTGLGKHRSDLQVGPDQWMDFCNYLQQESPKRNISIFYPPAFIRNDQAHILENYGYRGCTARNLERLAIFPDRRVYICSAFFDSDLHYGTFENGSIIPRFEKDNELALVGSVAQSCRKCPNSAFCKAGCAAYDYFEHTYPTKECDQEVIPICPLWSMPAEKESIKDSLYVLR
ncbi:MAG: radical SAM protein [Cyclobacteriaceae bacterium]